MKKSIVSVIAGIAGIMAGAGVTIKVLGESLSKTNNLSDKHLALFLMMNQWVKVKQEGKSLVGYFEANGYRKIAVYGMSYVGETLIDELKGSGIEVAYGIDNRADSICLDLDILTIEDNLEEVDAVVVTAITYFEEIAEKLERKLGCPIFSLEDILYEV